MPNCISSPTCRVRCHSPENGGEALCHTCQLSQTSSLSGCGSCRETTITIMWPDVSIGLLWLDPLFGPETAPHWPLAGAAVYFSAAASQSEPDWILPGQDTFLAMDGSSSAALPWPLPFLPPRFQHPGASASSASDPALLKSPQQHFPIQGGSSSVQRGLFFPYSPALLIHIRPHLMGWTGVTHQKRSHMRVSDQQL